jgi:PAS domain S-box-containing protein
MSMAAPRDPPEGAAGAAKPLLPTLGEALRALVARDAITQLSVLALVLAFLLELTPLAGLFARPPYYRLATAFATLMVVVACFLDRDRVDHREQGFWRTILLATAQLAGVALMRVAVDALQPPDGSDLRQGLKLAAELLRTGGLITLVLAIHLRPHEPSRQKLAHYERSAGLPTALLLAFCAVLYFGVVPVTVDGELTRLNWMLTLALLPLNVYLIFRCLWWMARTPQPRWQSIYLLLGLALAVFTLSLVRDQDSRVLSVVALGSEIASSLLAILAIRLRHYRFPVIWQRDVIAHPAEAKINPGSRSLLLATLVPVLHLLGYRLHFFEDALRAPREQMLVLWMLIAALVGAAQHRRARHLAGELVAERRRIEASLLRSERDLQLAEERRRADEALMRSREKYQRAFRASPYALLITSIEDGRLVEFNERFLELTGYSRDEMIGRTTLELGIWADLEERNRFLGELRDKGRAENFELTFRRRDGVLHRAIANAEKLELQGKPGMLAIARDRTLDEQREEQRAALLEVFVGTGTPLLALDDQEQVIAANPAAEELFGAGEAEGRKLELLLPDRHALARLAAARVEALERGSASTSVNLIDGRGERREMTVFVVETADRDLPTAFLLVFDQSAQIPSNP